jgi:hypothetical protein
MKKRNVQYERWLIVHTDNPVTVDAWQEISMRCKCRLLIVIRSNLGIPIHTSEG